YRVVFEDRALAYEQTTQSTAEEFSMRVRVVTRGMRGLLSVPDLFQPWKHPWVCFQLVSHKVLRWLVPVFLFVLLAASTAQADRLYILPFFEEFFQYYASEFQILQVSSSRAMGKRPRFQLLRELTYLYGPLGMARVAAEILSSRVLGLIPRGRDAGTFHTLAQLCRAYR